MNDATRAFPLLSPLIATILLQNWRIGMRKYGLALLLAVSAFAMTAHESEAGWNYITRKKCGIFRKYWVEAHAGFKVGSSVSINGSMQGDCTYAHVGKFSSNGPLGILSEAEGANSSAGLNGYARCWAYWYGPDYYSGIAGETKFKISPEEAAQIAAELKAGIPEKTRVETANIKLMTGPIVFSPGDVKVKRAPRVTIPGMNGTMFGKVGYSVLEIVVWTPKDNLKTKETDMNVTKDKLLWSGKIVVHDDKVQFSGSMPPDLLKQSETSGFSIKDKTVAIDLPAGLDLDKVAISVRGDSGDKSVILGSTSPVN
jgi:hypothetical protein